MGQTRSEPPSLTEIAGAFLKIGALSYGGPAILGIMQSEVQEKKQWMSKEAFLEGLALVNMLPGPPASQLSIYIGHECRGWRGGIVAGLCFILPAFLILMSLTWLYNVYGSLGVARDAFYGLGPVVLAIFAVAVWRLGRVGVKSAAQIAIGIVSAAIVAFTPVGLAPVLLLAGCTGVALYHSRKWGLLAAVIVLAVIGLAYLAAPPAVHATTSTSTTAGLWDLALFFVQAGAFTFGGGITILAFVQDQVVNELHWLSSQEFIDGLALGQLTPGPVLMLAAFIGYRLQGVLGGVVSAFAIFLPAFVMMLSIVPALKRLRELLWIKAAMRGIVGAVIGALVVSIARLLPHATPDAFTFVLFVLTIAGILLWRLAPVTLMLAGSVIGIAARLKPLQRLKDLAWM
jgi:chromate transporter